MICYSRLLSPRAISILLVSFLLAAASCHSRSNTSSAATDTVAAPVKQAAKRVDSLHEVVMNSIGPLRKLQDSVRHKIATARDTAALSHVAEALHREDTGMFGWMGRYDTELKGKSDSEKVSYLHLQFRKLNRLNKTMDSTMHEARRLLK